MFCGARVGGISGERVNSQTETAGICEEQSGDFRIQQSARGIPVFVKMNLPEQISDGAFPAEIKEGLRFFLRPHKGSGFINPESPH